MTDNDGNRMTTMKIWLKCCLLASCVIGFPGLATEHDASVEIDIPAQVVEYSAAYFAIYNPNTAMDMVRQIPGFQVDDGGGRRGFASAAGNVLINGRRPSAKQDSPSAILSRIPAAQVERIELIRGQVRGVDLRGQSNIVNVFLIQEDIPAAIRWDIYVQHNNRAAIRPGGSISLSDTFKNIDYNAGLVFGRNTSGFKGTESEYDSGGVLTKQMSEKSTETGYSLRGLTFAASSWIGETFAQFNSRFSLEDSNNKHPSNNVNLMTGVIRDVFITDEEKNPRLELGFDLERNLHSDLAAKAIMIFINGKPKAESTRSNSDSVNGLTLTRLANRNTENMEGIGRLELDWTGIPQHNIQLNLESAYNSLEGSLVQTDDTGTGPVYVDIPGSDVRVEEVRGDVVLKDTWTVGNFELDYGLGVELSTLKQSGENEQKRNFTFMKPMGSLTYSGWMSQHIRLRVEREVSQLNFNDFISATVFADDNLLLGNPNLEPESTWVTEFAYEYRFGRVGVMKVTGFQHWISDVLDLLPLTDTDAVPGNIGDGRRWGLGFESTVSMEWLGLAGSKLNFTARWQDSEVVDPVTGEYRILSGEGGQTRYVTLANRNRNNEYFLKLDYRQDLELSKVAWGWAVAERAKRPLFKVNEMDIYNEDFAIDVFVETTRWFGVKVGLSIENLLDDPQRRERTLFTGRRNLSLVDYLLVGERQIGRRINFSVTGSF